MRIVLLSHTDGAQFKIEIYHFLLNWLIALADLQLIKVQLIFHRIINFNSLQNYEENKR